MSARTTCFREPANFNGPTSRENPCELPQGLELTPALIAQRYETAEGEPAHPATSSEPVFLVTYIHRTSS